MKKDKFVWDDADISDQEAEHALDDIDATYEMFNNVKTDNEIVDTKKQPKVKIKSSKALKPILVILIILLVLYGYNTLNVFTLNAVTTNELIFIKKENLMQTGNLVIGESYSRSDLRQTNRLLVDSQIGDIDTSYDLDTGEYHINVEEIKPLAMNNGTLYYEDGGEILSTKEQSYVVPILFNFPDDLVQEILGALNTLDYSIIKEIAAIELLQKYDENSLVILQMTDGNYIEIYINQIATKMPYYLQIQAILEEENNNQPGLIHLDIGDYYEPIN